MTHVAIGNKNIVTACSGRAFPFLKRVRERVGATTLRAPFVWLRHRGLRPTDVFLATYPRSGLTWLRFMLFDIVTGKNAQFESVNVAMPSVAEHGIATPLLRDGRRIISTHETYRSEYGRGIYMVRDVRDCLISGFLRERAKGVATSFDEYLKRFLDGRKRYGSWPDHLYSWVDSETARRGDLLLIKYEDLRGKPEEGLRKVLNFLHIEADPEAIRRAIADNNVERMREKEDESRAMPGPVVRRPFQGIGGEDGRFVREGSAGGWRNRLTKTQVRLIEQHTGVALLRMGYTLVSEGEPVTEAVSSLAGL